MVTMVGERVGIPDSILVVTLVCMPEPHLDGLFVQC